MKTSARNNAILQKLAEIFPNPVCALDYQTPYQLLVATILSAQCTDVRVNLVTPALFAAYPTAEKAARADITHVEELVHSTGFYRNKAKAIVSSAQDIVEKHQGKVPRTIEALTALRGVGRKTANVVLGNAFGINLGVVVDTHVGRLSRRFGMTKHKDAVKIEKDLMKIVPQKDWTIFAHRMILHGRETCKSQNPKCDQCKLAQICPSAFL